jgi:prolycopene isomerase
MDARLGKAEFIETHAAVFPQERKNLEHLVAICEKINEEIKTFSASPTILDLVRAIRKSPTLVKYSNSTLEQVMSKHTKNEKLKAVFSALWPYLGLPPTRVSFLYWSAMLMSYLEEGAYYCKGTFQNLVNALVTSLQNNGGELLLHTRAERIVVKQGKVTGVKLENGEEVRVSTVVSNVDATQTFEEMVGENKLPGSYLKKLRRMKPSLSAFVVYLATDLDLKQLGAKHEMFYYESWDHEEAYDSMIKGEVSGSSSSMVVNSPTLTDPSLAPRGQSLMTITSLVPYDIGASWREEKTKYAERLMQKVESKFPGLSKHTLMLEGATPRTMERYTLNLTGAIYGWEVSPRQVGRNRLDHKTPIEGLYLSGHWTQPGGGIYGVTVSGIQTAQMILGYKNIGDLFEDIGGKQPSSNNGLEQLTVSGNISDKAAP